MVNNALSGPELYSISLEPKWENIELDELKIEQFGCKKWILAGSLTFKKRPEKPENLSTLTFHWQGPRLDSITGSLYKKNPDKPFLPFEDMLISDGTWNKTKQTLTFSFNNIQNLGSLNVFYLTLTIPSTLEELIKSGSFTLEPTGLPTPYKRRARTSHLSLTFADIPTSNKGIITAKNKETLPSTSS